MLWRYRYVVAVVAGVMIGLCATPIVYFLRISQQALRGEIVPTPRGSVALLGDPLALPELLARIAATPSGDAYFFYPNLAMLPFLTAREQVSKYDIFWPGQTLPSQYQDACMSVMRHASWVVIDRQMTDRKGLTIPVALEAAPDETKRFEQALRGGFELVAQERTFELRRRREGISDAACTGIAE
jgi:hypothetical protein